MRLRARTLSGVVTLNGKPISGVLMRLFDFIGPRTLVGNMDINAKRQARMSEVKADKHGRFSFGDVPAGRYVLVTSGGSTNVEVVSPTEGQTDTLVINSFGMGCQSASATPG
jgi:hypothetical protein